MICPLSEKRSRGVRLGFGMQPNVYQLRDGADDEDSRSAVTRHGEEDHVVASSRDHRVSARTMRRWRERLELHGYDGLTDRRKGLVSPKRVPLEMCETVLGLYR